MKNTNRIFLLGFMGSGKSTLGKKLAVKLNLDFVDLDELIERNLGSTVQELFDSKGEEFFRQIEHNHLKELIGTKNSGVIALGGGTPCFYDNMDLINKAGLSIYIKYNANILTNRLINAIAERPLIKGRTKQELNKYIKETLIDREQFYGKSDFIVENKNIKIEDLIALIQDS